MTLSAAPRRHRFPASLLAKLYGYIIALITVTLILRNSSLFEVLV